MKAEQHFKVWSKAGKELHENAEVHSKAPGPYHAAFSAAAVLALKVAQGYAEAAKQEREAELS